MTAEPVYRALLAVDVEKSAKFSTEASRHLRRSVRIALAEACAESGIDWDSCEPRDTGDGLIAFVPADTPKTRLLRPLLNSLAETLRYRNRFASDDCQIRIRVALHAGDLVRDDDGYTGEPLVALARLLDAAQVKRALGGAPRTATVAVVASDDFYRGVIAQGHRGIDPEQYTRITVRVKETVAPAWVTIIGHGAPPASIETEQPPAELPPRPQQAQHVQDHVDLVRPYVRAKSEQPRER